MKRKLIPIIAHTIIFLLALAGCSSEADVPTHYDTPMYSITVENGQYLLTPKSTTSDETVPSSVGAPSSIDTCSSLLFPSFSSVAEMRQSIITGSYTEGEYGVLYMNALTSSSDNEDGTIEICDLNKLHDCTMPADMDTKYISWYGDYYAFALTGETSEWGAIIYGDTEGYTDTFNEEYMDFLSNPNVTVTKQEQIEDRAATVYYGFTDIAELKDICYEIREGDKHIFVREKYLLDADHDLMKKSSTVPSSIDVWGTDGDEYFYGSFFHLSERPSVEWLSEFGLTPYVDSSTS